MGKLKSIVTPLHKATQRDYLARMQDHKIECMIKAKEYGFDYWDGDRRFGYGGYKYIPGRWKPVAETLIQDYNLKPGSKVLDVGCGKGFLLYEMLLIEPRLEVIGFDSSVYGLENAKEEVKPYLFQYKAQDPYPFGNNEFDLVISLGTFHNLKLFELKSALKEMERVGKDGYLMLESYRNEKELFNLECWALTAESLLEVSEWIWLYREFGYTGDYEFIFFE
ncbi:MULTISPECIES: class I SAM-dependent methyltransferase [Leptospira]|uniref:class I SAM-dependent methyltransferase n=1 Tax=Leptospira TaxID=171 RepID=UPI0002977ACC|nr:MULTISPECIES: class I SAM-dependent methyltransferase [Leptospira]EMO08038.1 methionine biosynthesis protein MetW-like protein [Leptospira borgpetersenii str. Noumea 25]EKQ99196.1 methionine biosynthesis protein MetW-like protein [Leptospira borgpetersenii serovar Castellonis str. 200801910]EMK10388.1 methionine biosynthesis protein MetW-like protein [Leptospira kirschneri]KGE24533.1 SAM-dependent methyltransferase [Leptospira borgpetersenii serovar Ballum]KON75736.1 Methionine biosynthesis